MSTLQIVVGGQYGSEGKGAVCAFLAKQAMQDKFNLTAVRVAGPNAGHTVVGQRYTSSGDLAPEWVALRQIPVAGVVNPEATLVIAQGSEIDFPVLVDEATKWSHYWGDRRIYVDEQATMIGQRHKDRELGGKGRNHDIAANDADGPNLVARVGSTGKGIGAARADRVMREANLFGDVWLPDGDYPNVVAANTARDVIDTALQDPDGIVQIEGTQGYGLGLHAGHYPQCTSSDCTAADFAAMAGVSPWMADCVHVWVCMRPFPIRVAGNSGFLFEETDWATLGLPVEYTTVTHKPRRVGRWDSGLAVAAVAANGGSPTANIALTMMDQVVPEIAGFEGSLNILEVAVRWPELGRWIQRVNSDTGTFVRLVGTGPDTMFRVRY